LRAPNYVMKRLYYDYFLDSLQDAAKYQIDASAVQAAVKDIAKNGSNDGLVKLAEGLLAALSNRDLREFSEKNVKIILCAYLSMSRLYLVHMEYEVEGGYVDVALLPNPEYDVPHAAVFETKYIKVEDYRKRGQAAVDEKRAEAATQVARYAASRKLTSLPGLKKWVLVFAGPMCVLNEEL